MKEKIKQIILNDKQNLNFSKLNEKWFKENENSLYSQIIEQTKNLNCNSFKEKLFCILNDINEHTIKCTICQKNNKSFISWSKGFRDVCSYECGRIKSSQTYKKNHKIHHTQTKEYKEKIKILNKNSKTLSNSLKNSWNKRKNRTPINKTSWTDVLNLFQRLENDLNFKLITTEESWKTSNKIHCICENNHEHFYSIHQLKNLKKCHLCLKPKKEKIVYYNLNEIKEFFSNYEILNYNEILNKLTKRTPLHLKCKNCESIFIYNDWYRTFKSLNKKEICLKCREDNRFNWLYEETKNENYKILKIWKHDKWFKFSFICPNNHEHEMFIINWLCGQRCGKCFNNISFSKKELEVSTWLKSFNINILENNRKILGNNKELDIFILENNIAIEFNGIYWHSSKFKDKNYHLNKLNKCNELNIDLIQINEKYWDGNKNYIKNIIKNRLKLNKIIKLNNYKIENIENIEKFLMKNNYENIFGKNKLFSLIENNEIFCIFEIENKILKNFLFKNNINIENWIDILFKNKLINYIEINPQLFSLEFLKNNSTLNFQLMIKTEPFIEKFYNNEIWNCGRLSYKIFNNEIESIEISEKQMLNEFNSLKSKQGNYYSTQMFSKAILYFQWKEFYKNELENWKDENIKIKLIENRKKYLNKSNFSNLEILRGLKISGLSKSFSHFSPLWIKAFIEEFNINSIYDPCGGWGHRLLGAWNKTYIYNDINTTTFNNAINMSKYFNLKNKIFFNEDAENLKLNQNVDCLFTCPPYHNFEKYSNIGAENKSLLNFKIWWHNVLQNSLPFINSYIAFVISNKLDNDIKYNICKNLNLKLIKEITLNKNYSHFQKNKNNCEILLIYEK